MWRTTHINDNILLNSSQNEQYFRKIILEELKTCKIILCSVIFFRTSCRLRNVVEKYEKAKQAKDDDIMQRRKDAICMPLI